MVTYEIAKIAAANLVKHIGVVRWLRGIAVESDAVDGFRLSVRVASDTLAAETANVPAAMNGVRVSVVRTEPVRAHGFRFAKTSA
jgi:hypothetical protein